MDGLLRYGELGRVFLELRLESSSFVLDLLSF